MLPVGIFLARRRGQTPSRIVWCAVEHGAPHNSGWHPLEPVIAGGGQERGLRAGTENVEAIVALGAACELAAKLLSQEQERLAALRDVLLQRLRESLPGLIHLNGHPTKRLPNTLNVSIEGVIG